MSKSVEVEIESREVKLDATLIVINGDVFGLYLANRETGKATSMKTDDGYIKDALKHLI